MNGKLPNCPHLCAYIKQSRNIESLKSHRSRLSALNDRPPSKWKPVGYEFTHCLPFVLPHTGIYLTRITIMGYVDMYYTFSTAVTIHDNVEGFVDNYVYD